MLFRGLACLFQGEAVSLNRIPRAVALGSIIPTPFGVEDVRLVLGWKPGATRGAARLRWDRARGDLDWPALSGRHIFLNLVFPGRLPGRLPWALLLQLLRSRGQKRAHRKLSGIGLESLRYPESVSRLCRLFASLRLSSWLALFRLRRICSAFLGISIAFETRRC
jgi:hypothetical protein